MRVVFMGTPDFAAASLRAILDAGYPVAGVFTQPDRPSGRGMALSASPVKALATDRGIPVYQPTKLRDGSALAALEALRPDIVVVVAYGRILPDALLAVPPLGCVNVHGSLLPAYRGSAPIQWAVLNGERRTGVSTMYLSHEMDAGDLIFQDETPIGEFETSGDLFDRLKEMGAALLVKTLRAIEAGRAPRQPQDHSRASYTRPLDKSMCPIDWTRSPREIVKHICGLQPWPVATMELEGKSFRVFAAEYTDTHTDREPGTVLSAGNAGIEIACGTGETLRITALQAPGKKRMSAGDYLRGHPLALCAGDGAAC
ncbi:MAG: methionyl-tRNA formyltransferase [Oscillospiraceae bacterium]|nr:methionyl-tRNA formyltransferase [Oscillospiraceae bacterium]